MALSHVQSNGAYGSSVTSIAVQFDSNVTAGSLLVAGCTEGSGTMGSCSDDDSGSWSEDTNGDAAGLSCAISSAPDANGGSQTTVTYSNGAGTRNNSIQVSEVSGALTSGHFDVGDSASTSWGGSITTTEVTTTEIDIVFGIGTWGSGGGAQVAFETGYTQAELQDPGDHGASWIYKIQSSTGAEDLLFDWTSNTYGVGCSAAYKPAGGDYSLTVDAGSFTVTGTAASLEYGRKVAAAAGSFAFTGQAAALEYGRKVAAAAGSYALTGQAATLKADRVLPIGAGSYAVTGLAAALLRGYPLAAEGGSFVVTGQDVTLLADRTLPVEAGSIVFTGSDVTLTYSAEAGYELTAESGSYTVTGIAAGLLRGSLLGIDAGAFSVTGQDAGLSADRVLSAGSDVFAISGSDVTLLFDSILNALSGSFVVTGMDADLQWLVAAGLATVTFTSKGPVVTLTGRAPAAGFTSKAPTVTFSAG